MTLPARSTAAVQLLRELADRIESGELGVSSIQEHGTFGVGSGPDPYTPLHSRLEIQTYVETKKSDC